jgi:hypothetical protein
VDTARFLEILDHDFTAVESIFSKPKLEQLKGSDLTEHVGEAAAGAVRKNTPYSVVV